MLRVGDQVAEHVRRVGAGAERERKQKGEHGGEVGVVGRNDGEQGVGGEGRPGGPVAHLARHAAHELVAELDQSLGAVQREGVGTDRRRQEIRGLAGHDEPREALVGGQQDQRHPEVQVPLLGPIAEVHAQLRLEQRRGQVPVPSPELLLRASHAGIGLPDAPEVLPGGVGVAAAHPLPQPGREVHARHTARRIVGPREAGKVRVADPVGEAGQIGGDSVGECDRGGAEVESLHRHERPWFRFWNSGHRLRSSGARRRVPPSPAQAGRSYMLAHPAVLARVRPTANLRGWDQRAGNRGVSLMSAAASRQGARFARPSSPLRSLDDVDGFAGGASGRSIACRTLDSSSSMV